MNSKSRSQDATPLGEGATTIALPHLRALIILLAGVAAGFVDGTTAPITPIGRAIVVNPVEPEKSYLAVFFEDGKRDHYTLSLPNLDAIARSWIVAYSNDINEEWQPLRPSAP